MRQVLRKLVATLVAAVTIATPARALADEAGKYCTTFEQVESNATGGDYVGGLLIYETMGTVARSSEGTTTTTTISASGTAGIPGSGVTTSGSTSTTTVAPMSTVTTEEPIGYYKMNDGSIYQINCLTGESTQLVKPKN
jgi:hypothetical protein